MMPTIDAVPIGTATNNSYATVAEADAYFDTQLRADAWNDANDDDKARSLIMATQQLDTEDYLGDRQYADQALKFPRVNIGTIDGVDVDGIIPIQIKEATYELAKHNLVVDTSQKTVLNQTTKKEKVGSLEVEYFGGETTAETSYTTDLPPYVTDLIEPLSTSVVDGAFICVSR